MKNNYLKIGLILCAGLFLLTSCFEDKGSYDYTTDSRLVSFEYKKFTFKLNQKVEVGIKIYTKSGYDHRNLSYEWRFNDKVIGQDSVLILEKGADGGLNAGENYLEIVAKDNKFGMRYSASITVTLEAAYGNGWVILNNESGVSKAHFMTMKDHDTPGEFETNIFESANDGELGTGPIKLRRNYYTGKGLPINEWEILQESRTVTVGLNDWTMSADVGEEFIAGAPSGFVAVNGFHRMGGSAILSRDGNLYMRNHDIFEGNPIPHSGRYSATPVYIEKGLQVGRMINFDYYTTFAWSVINHSIMHDVKNNRLVMLEGFAEDVAFGSIAVLDMYGIDDPVKPGGASPSDVTLVMPDLANLGNYTVVNMVSRPSYLDLFAEENTAMSDNFVVLKNGAGKQFILRYDLISDYGRRSVKLTDMYEFPNDGGFDDKSEMAVYAGGDEYILYTGAGANSNKLYLYNYLTKQAVKCIYEAPSTITAIRTGVVHLGLAAAWGGGDDTYFERLLVGTQDGLVALLDMSAGSLSQDKVSVMKTVTTAGRVVDIEFFEAPSTNGGSGY